MKKLCDEQDYGFYLSQKLKSYFDLRVRDYAALKAKGFQIKNETYRVSKELEETLDRALHNNNVNEYYVKVTLDENVAFDPLGNVVIKFYCNLSINSIKYHDIY